MSMHCMDCTKCLSNVPKGLECSETIIIDDTPQQPELPWLPDAIVIAPKLEKKDSKEHDENLQEAIALLCSQQPSNSILHECQTIDDSDTDEQSYGAHM